MLLLALPALAADLPDGVEIRTIPHRDREYRVVTVDLRQVDLDLYGRDPDQRTFDGLRTWLSSQGRELVVATNAGMYHPDHSPVGLHVERGTEHAPLFRGPSSGNFGLMPNGVFWVDADGAHVATTEAYASERPRLATQSGPMLVVDGALHPAFKADSPNLLLRSGVGVSDAWTVHLAISETFTRFHELATLFRDVLGCEDALYLDGTVSRLVDPDHPTADGRFSGILAVTVPAGGDADAPTNAP